jgi:hypothetical protein
MIDRDCMIDRDYMITRGEGRRGRVGKASALGFHHVARIFGRCPARIEHRESSAGDPAISASPDPAASARQPAQHSRPAGPVGLRRQPQVRARIGGEQLRPWITMQSEFCRSCRKVVPPPRPNEVPSPAAVELWHTRAWFST